MRRLVPALVAALSLAACGKLEGFGGAAPPLVSFTVDFTGDLGPLRPANVTSDVSLSVALVWGAQWLTEPFCVLTPEAFDEPPGYSSPADVKMAGCRDTFGFVPNVVAASVPLAPSGPTTLTLEQLPTADVMVGDVTARVAYGSLVVFDDRDGGGLELAFPHRTPTGGRGGRDLNMETTDSQDVVYGASFVTMLAPDTMTAPDAMTAPERRVAYHEGGAVSGAFYPLKGCPPLGPAFSIVGAGGFMEQAGLTAALAGQIPAQDDPATCFAALPDATTVEVTAQAPADVEEVACDEQTADSSIRYRQPPDAEPDFTGRIAACAHLPTFDTGSQPSTLNQLVVSGRVTDRCKGLTHYTLRGCREDVTCVNPDWDLLASPPSWWKCN